MVIVMHDGTGLLVMVVVCNGRGGDVYIRYTGRKAETQPCTGSIDRSLGMRLAKTCKLQQI